MPPEWPNEQELREKLRAMRGTSVAPPSALVTEWQGAGFRFATLEYADRENFTSGQGARRNGGRFTPQGGTRTLYLATDPETATAEMEWWHRKSGLSDLAFKPRVLAAVAVSVGLVLDLTAEPVRSHLSLSPELLAAEWDFAAFAGRLPPSQAFGRLIFEAGIEGILVASARRPGGSNLVLFPENFRGGSHALMIEAG